MILNALLAAIATTAGAAIALAGRYLLCRIALDRHRLAAWESAWAATGVNRPSVDQPPLNPTPPGRRQEVRDLPVETDL